MKNTKLAGLLVALMGFAGVANTASADGFYVGVGALKSGAESGFVADSRTTMVKSNVTHPLLTMGYQHSYGNFLLAGEIRHTDSYGDQIKVSGLEFSVNPGWKINDAVSVFARFGAAKLKSELPGVASSAEANATVQGFGVDYRITPNLNLRAEYQALKSDKTSIPTADINASDIKSAGVSLLYRF